MNQRAQGTNPDKTSIYTNNLSSKNLTERTRVTTNYRSRTIPKIENKGFVFDSNTSTNHYNLVNTNSLNNSSSDTNYINKTPKINTIDIPYRTQIDRTNNSFKYISNFNKDNNLKRNKSYSNLSSNRTTTNDNIIKKNEVEIIGKFTNERNTYRFIDHKHPNTLYESECNYCQNMVKDNKLYLTYIKDESINGNHCFYASFGRK